MKKRVGLILLATVMLCTGACSRNPISSADATAVTTPSAIEAQVQDPGWYGAPYLPSPIDIANMTELQEFITRESKYKETVKYDDLTHEQMLAYDHLRSTLQERGILIPSCYDQHVSELTLFPEVRYEDVGIKFTCTCNEEKIDYFIYYLQSGYENPSSMREYWNYRFGSKYHGDATELTIERNGKQITAHVYAHNSRKAISFAENGFEIKIIHESAKDSKAIAEAFGYSLTSLASA